MCPVQCALCAFSVYRERTILCTLYVWCKHGVGTVSTVPVLYIESKLCSVYTVYVCSVCAACTVRINVSLIAECLLNIHCMYSVCTVCVVHTAHILCCVQGMLRTADTVYTVCKQYILGILGTYCVVYVRRTV